MPKFSNLIIGVLALQGDFERHIHQLNLVGAMSCPVRLAKDLSDIDGLIIPGGESTTMNILIDRFHLRESLSEFVHCKPVWGTCAGMIMLAKEVEDNQANIDTLAAIDIGVLRNGYGRQMYSFRDSFDARLNGEIVNLKASFIRAPRVVRMGEKVIKLAECDGQPVLLSEKKVLVSSFHTELDDDTRLLEHFLNDFC